MKSQKVELTFPANLKFAAFVRQIAEGVFRTAGFDNVWVNRLTLVTDEIFMNAVRYGSKDDNAKVYLVITYDDKQVECAVSDEGSGSKKVTHEELLDLIEQNAAHHEVTNTSGRGLALIAREWTDDLKVTASSHGGVTVSFVKQLEEAAPLPISEKALSPAHTDKKAYHLEACDSSDEDAVDKFSASVLEKIADMSSDESLVLDFSEIEYINSMCIGKIAAWYNAASKKKCELVLEKVHPAVQDVLETVGLTQLISIKP